MIWSEIKFESWEKTARTFRITNAEKLKQMVTDRVNQDGAAVLYRDGKGYHGMKMLITKEML